MPSPGHLHDPAMIKVATKLKGKGPYHLAFVRDEYEHFGGRHFAVCLQQWAAQWPERVLIRFPRYNLSEAATVEFTCE